MKVDEIKILILYKSIDRLLSLLISTTEKKKLISNLRQNWDSFFLTTKLLSLEFCNCLARDEQLKEHNFYNFSCMFLFKSSIL